MCSCGTITRAIVAQSSVVSVTNFTIHRSAQCTSHVNCQQLVNSALFPNGPGLLLLRSCIKYQLTTHC